MHSQTAHHLWTSLHLKMHLFVDFWNFPDAVWFTNAFCSKWHSLQPIIYCISYNFSQSHERKFKDMTEFDHVALHLCSVQLCGPLHHNGHTHTTEETIDLVKKQLAVGNMAISISISIGIILYRRRGKGRGCLARCVGILFMFSFDELCLVTAGRHGACKF